MEKMTFYEINERTKELETALEECVDEETGEILSEKYEEIAKEFADVTEAGKEKTEGVCLLVKNKEIFLEDLQEEKKRITDRIDTVKKDIERTKDFLDRFVLKGDKFETPKVRCSYRKTSSVEVVDESIVPKEYIKEKITTAPDKTAIKSAIKDGKEVRGCNLREEYKLSIK